VGKVVTSVSLPAEVAEDAGRVARELHKSRSEVIKDALLGYLRDHEWRKLQEETRRYAEPRGVHTEADVERVVRELREAGSRKR
jgi:metal-responsive CopG/Arc/MetJ family transcriptional regulator